MEGRVLLFCVFKCIRIVLIVFRNIDYTRYTSAFGVYEGQYKNGRRHGNGTFTAPNGDA
jgi:hypothetical protein